MQQNGNHKFTWKIVSSAPFHTREKRGVTLVFKQRDNATIILLIIAAISQGYCNL